MERLQSLGLPAEIPKFVNTLMPFGIIALVAMLCAAASSRASGYVFRC